MLGDVYEATLIRSATPEDWAAYATGAVHPPTDPPQPLEGR